MAVHTSNSNQISVDLRPQNDTHALKKNVDVTQRNAGGVFMELIMDRAVYGSVL